MLELPVVIRRLTPPLSVKNVGVALLQKLNKMKNVRCAKTQVLKLSSLSNKNDKISYSTDSSLNGTSLSAKQGKWKVGIV